MHAPCANASWRRLISRRPTCTRSSTAPSVRGASTARPSGRAMTTFPWSPTSVAARSSSSRAPASRRAVWQFDGPAVDRDLPPEGRTVAADAFGDRDIGLACCDDVPDRLALVLAERVVTTPRSVPTATPRIRARSAMADAHFAVGSSPAATLSMAAANALGTTGSPARRRPHRGTPQRARSLLATWSRTVAAGTPSAAPPSYSSHLRVPHRSQLRGAPPCIGRVVPSSTSWSGDVAVTP